MHLGSRDRFFKWGFRLFLVFAVGCGFMQRAYCLCRRNVNFQWHWCLLDSFCSWFCVVVHKFVISMSSYVVCNCFQFCLYTALKLTTNKNTNSRLCLYVGTLSFCQLLMLWAVAFGPGLFCCSCGGCEHVLSPQYSPGPQGITAWKLAAVACCCSGKVDITSTGPKIQFCCN